MRIHKTFLAALLTGLLVGPLAAAQGVVASIEFLPPSVLPGVPVSLVVRIKNGSARPVDLTSYRFYVRDASGLPQLVKPQHSETATDDLWIGGPDGEPRVIAPGETFEDYRVALSRDDSGWANNPFYAAPGTVTVSMTFKIDGKDVSTGPTPLIVRQPTGEDLAVWNLMLQRAGAGGWKADDWRDAGDLAGVVFRDYPGSLYTIYFAQRMPTVPCPYGRSGCYDLRPFEQALLVNPPSPLRDAALLAVGGGHIDRAEAFLARRNVDRAAEEMSLGKPFLDELLRITKIPEYRESGEKELLKVGSRADLLARLHAEQPPYPAPLRVKPIVECVDVSGDLLIARFGYNNPNPIGKELQPGSGNRFDPAPVDRGEPRWFVPGTQHGVAGASGSVKKGVSWSLDGEVATAMPDFTTGCMSQQSLPLRPFVECAKADGPNMTARFGYENPNAYPIRIAAGPTNLLSGTTDTKGQPTVFESGTHHDALTVTGKEAKSVSWTLGSTTAVANATKSTQCPNSVK